MNADVRELLRAGNTGELECECGREGGYKRTWDVLDLNVNANARVLLFFLNIGLKLECESVGVAMPPGKDRIGMCGRCYTRNGFECECERKRVALCAERIGL